MADGDSTVDGDSTIDGDSTVDGDSTADFNPLRFRVEGEQHFYMQLAFTECKRWIQAVTDQQLSHGDDLRKSLENGVVLCQLLNALRPGSVHRINKKNTPIAGLDNLSVFIKSCQTTFGLTSDQLFDPSNLEDLSNRAIADDNREYIQEETTRRLLNVVLTLYWLAQVVDADDSIPKLDYTAFSGVISRNVKAVTPTTSHPHTHTTMNDQQSRKMSGSRSYDSNRHSAAFSDSTDEWHANGSDASHDSIPHTRSSSADSSEFYGSLRNDQSRSSSLTDKSRTGGSGDPLQYVKYGRKYSLADTAKEQMEQVAEVKQRTWSYDDDDDVDWKSNLSSWRNRRRKMSAASLAAKELLESNYGEDEVQVRPTKTFDQIVKDREKRVSSYNSYPIGDDDGSMMVATAEVTTAPTPPLRHAQSYIEETLNQKNKGSNSSSVMSGDVIPSQNEDAPATDNTRESKSSRLKKFTYPVDNDDDDDIWTTPEPKTTTTRKEGKEGLNDATISAKDDFGLEKKDQANKENTARRRSEVSLFERKFGAKEITHNDGGHAGKPKMNNDAISKPGRVTDILRSFEKKDNENNNNRVASSRIVDRSRSTSSKSRDFQQSTVETKVLPGGRRSASESWETPAVRKPEDGGVAKVTADQSKKDYVDKLISIRQGPKREPMFGFTFCGGKDVREPVVVDHVDLGSAADVCELNACDEIVAIDRQVTSDMTHADVRAILTKAVDRGQIQLKIRRYFSRGARLSRYNNMADSPSQPRRSSRGAALDHGNSDPQEEVEDGTPLMDKLLRGHDSRDDPPHFNKSHRQSSSKLPSDGSSERRGRPSPASLNHDLLNEDAPTSSAPCSNNSDILYRSTQKAMDTVASDDIMMAPIPANDGHSQILIPSSSYPMSPTPAMSPTAVTSTSVTSPGPIQTANPINEVVEERSTLRKPARRHEPVEVNNDEEGDEESDEEGDDDDDDDDDDEEEGVYENVSVYHHDADSNNKPRSALYPEPYARTNELIGEPSVSVNVDACVLPRPWVDQYPTPQPQTDGSGPPESLMRWQKSKQRPQVKVSEMSAGEEEKLYQQYGIQPSVTSSAQDQRVMDEWLQQSRNRAERATSSSAPGSASTAEIELRIPAGELLIDPANRPESQTQQLPVYSFNVHLPQQVPATTPDSHDNGMFERELTEKEKWLKEQENEIRRQQLLLQEEREKLQRERQVMYSERDSLSHGAEMIIHEPMRDTSCHQVTYSTVGNPVKNAYQFYNSSQEVLSQNHRPASYGTSNNTKRSVKSESNIADRTTDWTKGHQNSSAQSSVSPLVNNVTPSSHWVLQEAEQRRLEAGDVGGPIKIPPNVTSRWCDDRLSQEARDRAYDSELDRSRQFLTQKLASVNQRSKESSSRQQLKEAQRRGSPESHSPDASRQRSCDTRTSISGKAKCSSCNEELGFGAAMVIEPLNLRFHMQCFACSVCHCAIGSGDNGADVRVRDSKLHCNACYMQHEGGCDSML